MAKSSRPMQARRPRTTAESAPTASRKLDRLPLLGALSGDVGFLIRRAQVWIFQDFIKTLSPCDIRPAQYAVLAVIDRNAGLSQMALSKTLNIERAHLMHMLDSLEDRKLLTRVPSERDRRSHALHLTPQGQVFLRRVRRLVAEHEANVAAKLGAKRCSSLLEALSAFK